MLVSQPLSIVTENFVQLSLNISEFVFNCKFLLGTQLNLFTNRFQPLDVPASLIGDQFNLFESTAVPRLHQSLARIVERFFQLPILHRLPSLLGESFESARDFILKNRNLFKILFDLILLPTSLANLIIIRGYTGDIFEHLAALSSGHDCQFGDITLKDDIVAISTGARTTEEPANLGGGGRAFIEVVGRIDIPLATEFNRAREPYFIGVNL